MSSFLPPSPLGWLACLTLLAQGERRERRKELVKFFVPQVFSFSCLRGSLSLPAPVTHTHASSQEEIAPGQGSPTSFSSTPTRRENLLFGTMLKKEKKSRQTAYLRVYYTHSFAYHRLGTPALGRRKEKGSGTSVTTKTRNSKTKKVYEICACCLAIRIITKYTIWEKSPFVYARK